MSQTETDATVASGDTTTTGGGLLAGRTILVTGVITDASIAFHIAKHCQLHGAKVILTAYGRPSLVKAIAKRLPERPPVIELDVQSEDDLAALADRVREHADSLDGVVHSIGFAPPSCLGDPFLDAPWKDVAVALEVSAYSYSALAKATRPLLNRGASIIGLDFDPRFSMPFYNWMSVAKNALEAVNRYVARELGPEGVRSNLVAAGPVKTLAAKAIAGEALGSGGELDRMQDEWDRRAPLGWDVDDPTSVATTAVALLSDLMAATTGTVIYADGGAGTVSFSGQE
ncbi:NADH-dependent enoyl-ACP reductase InhA [Dietzia cinnamea]|uniref:Enoyl-[acyl-carrier-protein] reductase [NADH] n=1 Tax=Dietzia cinnamea TaxID=321318 RepID=A0ABV3YKG8_9ACTN|nr:MULTISPECIES: NADH-dependent enoyl-ACP reductase InhA [Dietzia]KZO59849.1 enoyl-ACP reductase [Dietzia maris]MBB1021919.1 enoyl-ACP reductase FabI [Dietzia sp. E1]MCT2058979.1 NADH-dependent enoyl-ACP reductase InhA [Dietzia cinnamea]MCT2097289.1 NADH-dependent enoyl-ACP reductase InhA [Dietzia cinnamea]